MLTKKIEARLKNHWFILIKKPTNGRHSLVELDAALIELNGNVRRVCDLVEKMTLDTKVAERMIKDNVSNSIDNS